MLTLIPLLRIVCATNNSRRPSNPSQWSAAADRQAGRGEGGSAAVGAAFINQTAGAEPRLAPLNRKPPGVFSGTSYSSVFRYLVLVEGGGANKDRRID